MISYVWRLQINRNTTLIKSFYDITYDVFFKEHFYDKYTLLSKSIQDLSVRLVSSIQADIFLISTLHQKMRKQSERCYPEVIMGSFI